MIIVKVTLLLGIAFLLGALLRRASAALRHLVWMLALAGTVGLTAITPLVPHLSVSLKVPPTAVLLDLPLSLADRPLAQDRPATGSPAAAPLPEAVTVTPSRSPDFSVDPGGTAPMGPLLIGALYLLGVLTVLGWYGLGRLSLSRLVKRGVPLESGEWSGLLHQVAREMGVSGMPRLYASTRVASPVTWGIRRPVVLLPAESTDWSTDRRRIVLAHELAHAARGDHLARWIGVLAVALYWFHPLVWAAFRRLGQESERAADDYLLTRGASGVDYAGHLLEIARRSRELRSAGLAAIGMARASQLEGRLLALLDSERNRTAPGRGFTFAAWTGLALLAFPLASLRVDRATEAARSRLTLESAEPTIPGQAQRADSVIERSVDAASGETLRLSLETGGAVTVRGWNRPQVQVRARLAGSDWRNTRVEVARSGSEVEVIAEPVRESHSYSSSHEFEIRVPDRFNIRLESAGGDLTIIGVEGTFRGRTGGGEIVLENATGEARLSTGGGDIRVSHSNLGGTVSTGGGRVTMSRVEGGLRGTSGSGPVVYARSGGEATGDLSRVSVDKDGIRLNGASPGVMYIRKAGGDITLEGAPDGAEVETGGGDIRIGQSEGTVKAQTGGGDVTIGPVAGSVNAGTGAGDIRITIAPADGDAQSVEVWAGVGTVIIEWPEGVPARFDLETAYTRNFRRQTRIETDLELTREETEEWDARQGTPRRYVRATGEVGNGGGLVRVRTVNGNIIIRRVR